MSRDRESISGAKSYVESGELWDSHDLDEVWDRTKPADLEVDLQSEKFFFSVESELAHESRPLPGPAASAPRHS